jgi:hypothetical protein
MRRSCQHSLEAGFLSSVGTRLCLSWLHLRISGAAPQLSLYIKSRQASENATACRPPHAASSGCYVTVISRTYDGFDPGGPVRNAQTFCEPYQFRER